MYIFTYICPYKRTVVALQNKTALQEHNCSGQAGFLNSLV